MNLFELLSEKVWTREQRLAAMEGITLPEVKFLFASNTDDDVVTVQFVIDLFLLMTQVLPQVVEYAKTFLDSHSLETLYYGNLSKGQARQLTGIQFHFQYISIFDFRQLTNIQF